MARSLSWIDPSEFDALVEATAWRRPAPRGPARPAPAPAPPETHVDSDLVAAESAPAVEVGVGPREADAPVASVRTSSRPTRSVTVASRPQPPGPSAVPPPPQYTPAATKPFSPLSEGGIEERLEHLVAWATERAGLRMASVIDSEGLLVAGAQPSSSTDTQAALAHAACRARWFDAIGAADRGVLSVRAQDETHVLVWETGPRGRFLLSLRGAGSPSAADLAPLGDALRGAL